MLKSTCGGFWAELFFLSSISMYSAQGLMVIPFITNPVNWPIIKTVELAAVIGGQTLKLLKEASKFVPFPAIGLAAAFALEILNAALVKQDIVYFRHIFQLFLRPQMATEMNS